ncbi:MAG: hypothetical protein ACKV2T_08750 [Kofleriaceae bacterium]
MKTASRLLIASLASLGFAGTALAQDATAPTEPDPNAPPPDGAVTDPNAMPDPNAPAAGSTRWPRAVIARPLTLPAGVFAVGADVVNFTESFFDPAIIRVFVGYGITDDIELAFAHYAFPTSDVGKGDILAQVGVKLARGAMGGKLEAIARAQIGYDLAASVDLMTGETSGAVAPLGLGVHVQYNVTDKISLVTPGNQLTVGLDPFTMALNIPVGVGFQATPELYVQLDTSLATINIKDSATAVIFADATPLAVTATYNVMPALDVLAGLALDLTPADPLGVGDTFAILLGARYYGGKLN